MYITIDKDFILRKEDIIGIFNIDSLFQTKEYNKLIEDLKNKKQIKDYSEGEKKTFILYQKDKEMYGIILNISSNSIEKRGKNKFI